MPAITGTIALLHAASKEAESRDIFGARAARDTASEIKGAQGKALDEAKLKAQADLQNQADKARGAAIRSQARQAGPAWGGTILTSPLGVPGQASTTKTVLGG
jgi:hypothetical protein